MKTRQGFVSNSSTSSFVLFGFLVDAEQFTEKSLKEKLNIQWSSPNKDVRIYDSEYYGTDDDGNTTVPEGKLLVGIHTSDIDHCGTFVMSITETLSRLNELQSKLGVSTEVVVFHYLTNQ